jgi:uncharacterized protein
MPHNGRHLVELDWTTGQLAEGLHCYRTEQFFEAHEYWEAVWLTLAEPEKSFLQALVQVSAAFHHLSRGNRIGTISLLTRSLHRLDRSPSQFSGMNVTKIREQGRKWLNALEAGSVELPRTYPEFEVLSQS